MPRRPPEHADAVREQIAEGARAAFAAGGFHGTSMAAIADAAGVSVGLIYRYFASKEALFVALCLGHSVRPFASVEGQLVLISDPAARLRAAFAAYLDTVDRDGSVILSALSAADSNPRIRAALDEREDALRGSLEHLLADAAGRGELSPAADIDGLARAVATLLDGVLVARATKGDDLDRERLLDVLAGFVIDAGGLAPAGSAPRGVPYEDAPDHDAGLERVIAIIPVRDLEVAKSRLGGTLDAEERQAIVVQMLERTVRAAQEACDAVIVVSPDPTVLDEARRMDAIALPQRTSGLNPALDEARTAAVARGASAVLVLPVDLAAVSGHATRDLIARAGAALEPKRPLVVIAPDRHGEGTNALLVSPPRAIPFRFGDRSCRAHLEAATAAGAVTVRLEGPLELDLDTPDDLLLAEPLLAHDHAV